MEFWKKASPKMEQKLREMVKIHYSKDEIEKLVNICKTIREIVWFNPTTFVVETEETGFIVGSNIFPVLDYALKEDWDKLNSITLLRMILLKTLELSHETRVLNEYWRYQHEMDQLKVRPEADRNIYRRGVKIQHAQNEEKLEKMKTFYNKGLQYLLENQEY